MDGVLFSRKRSPVRVVRFSPVRAENWNLVDFQHEQMEEVGSKECSWSKSRLWAFCFPFSLCLGNWGSCHCVALKVREGKEKW